MSDDWTDASGRIYSGTICGVGADEALPVFPPRRGKLVVTGLGCGIRAGDQPIPLQDIIVQRTIGAFEGRGFKRVEKPNGATKEDLSNALEHSDICVIVGHAKEGSFRFPVGEFGAAEWRDIHDKVRCQLLIIAGCGLGDLATARNPLLYEAVRRGVTCIASTHTKQDPVVAREFLAAISKHWKKGRTSGPSVAQALSLAGRQVPMLNCPELVREQVNSYVIIGNPTLRLAFRWTSEGARR